MQAKLDTNGCVRWIRPKESERREAKWIDSTRLNWVAHKVFTRTLTNIYRYQSLHSACRKIRLKVGWRQEGHPVIKKCYKQVSACNDSSKLAFLLDARVVCLGNVWHAYISDRWWWWWYQHIKSLNTAERSGLVTDPLVLLIRIVSLSWSSIKL